MLMESIHNEGFCVTGEPNGMNMESGLTAV